MRQRIAELCIILASLALVACGGGGGGGDSGGGGGGGNGGGPGGETSGLVPQAQPLGDTLYAKGTDVRPVIAGATWSYHSHDFVTAGPDHYDVTATAVTPDQVDEVASDDPATINAVMVDRATGSVSMSFDASIIPGATIPLHISGFELRSPVRVNDQYVLLDQHLDDAGVDFDGDGSNDAVDVAIWRVVVGKEPVTIHAGMVPLDAVRIDTYFAARITPSRGGSAQLTTANNSSWYAPGIGLIRNVSASTDPGRAYDYEDILTGFDGVDHGWGAIVQPPQSAGSGANWTGRAYGAIQTPDGLLAMTSSYMVRIDKMGRLTGSVLFADTGLGNDPGTLVATSSGPKFVVSSNPADIRVLPLRDDGTLDTTKPVAHIDATAYQPPDAFVTGRYLSFSPGTNDRLWLTWIWKTNLITEPVDHLVVRAFRFDGTPLTDNIELPTTASLGSKPLTTVTTSGGLIATWNDSGSGTDPWQSAQAELDKNGQLLWITREVTGGWPGPDIIWPIQDESTTWLLWRQSSQGTDQNPYGVRLDATGNFVGVGTDVNAFSSQTVGAIDSWFLEGWPRQTNAHDGHFFSTATVNSPAFPNEDMPTGHLEFLELDAGTGNLATEMRPVKRLTISGLVFPSELKPFVFDDRVILLPDNGNTLQPVVIWR